MRYVNPKNCDCQRSQHKIEPRNTTTKLGGPGSSLNRIFSSFSGENKRHSAVGSWGIAWGEHNSVSQPGSFEITRMNAPRTVSARSCGGPRSDFLIASKDSETVPSFKVVNNQPSNFGDSKWIINFYTGVCENNFGLRNKNPEKYVNGNAIENADNSSFVFARINECGNYQDLDRDNNPQVNPITGGAEDSLSRHGSKTTRMNLEYTGVIQQQEGKI